MKPTPEQTNPLKKLLTSADLTNTEWDEYISKWEYVEFPKYTELVAPGGFEKYFYFVISGVQRLYHLLPDGQEKILGFSYKGDFSGVYDSFIQGTPSLLYLDTLSQSKMLRIHRNDLLDLYSKHQKLNHWARTFAEAILFGRQKREVELLSMTAEERYEAFMSRNPNELFTIPMKYLASYLNMTPETFSRIRANY